MKLSAGEGGSVTTSVRQLVEPFCHKIQEIRFNCQRLKMIKDKERTRKLEQLKQWDKLRQDKAR